MVSGTLVLPLPGAESVIEGREEAEVRSQEVGRNTWISFIGYIGSIG